jgi:phage terminase large subunit
MWFNKPPDVQTTPEGWYESPTVEAGMDAIGWYHEKKDEVRAIGLGPEHDWASHGADAFGLMAVAYETPKKKTKAIAYPKRNGVI